MCFISFVFNYFSRLSGEDIYKANLPSVSNTLITLHTSVQVLMFMIGLCKSVITR